MSETILAGWIPYEERTFDQQVESDQFRENTAPFGAVNPGVGDLPKHALLYDLEIKATGRRLNRVWQKTGSCVGAGAARCYGQTMCGDICVRKTVEEVKELFPWTTYGIGRQMGGMRGPGNGSYGSVQARAAREWGLTAADDPRFPKPTIKDGWIYWSASIEMAYSSPSRWPVKEVDLRPGANERQVLNTARVTKWEELLQAFAQGYGVTCASMFGTRQKVKEGFAIGEWNGSWAHQMSWSGYYEHPTFGVLVACDNQWGPCRSWPGSPPECPFLTSKGVYGSFWIPQKTIEKILSQRSAEVYVHSDTEDWPVRQLDWDSQGMG